MSSGSTLFLAVLTVGIICTTLSAASRRPHVDWNYYHFDGSAFSAGQPEEGVPYIAVRDHVAPVVLMRAAKIEAVALPKGKGAIAGICYMQTSGGKISHTSGYLPYPHTPVTFYSAEKPVTTVQTDEHGYFLAVLDAGMYRLGTTFPTVEVTVDNAKTTLVPLRAGKRMVD